MAFPEAGWVRRTFVVREMDAPPGFDLTRRGLLRWVALATGLLSKNERRPTALYVLDGVLHFLAGARDPPTTRDLQAYIRKRHRTPVSEKLLRYHLGKLLALGLLVRRRNRYHLNPAPEGARDSFAASFAYWVARPAEKSLARVERALEKLQEKYR